jgi:hypothetical protein
LVAKNSAFVEFSSIKLKVKMKILAIVAIFAAVSTSNAMTLSEAMRSIQVALNLDTWITLWSVNRNGDNEVCRYSNELNQPTALNPAFARLASDPVYQELETAMIAGGVDWMTFIENVFKPALGQAPLIATCTTASRGGNAAFHAAIRGSFTLANLQTAVDNANAQSPEFAQIFASVAAKQTEIRTMRCSPEIQNVYNIKQRNGLDMEFVYAILKTIFGWTTINPC